MHRHGNKGPSKLTKLAALLALGTTFQFLSPAGCDQALADFTRIFDPCGTIFANCVPGSFFANTVEIGSHEAQCFDPACTLPGQCGDVLLGAFQDPCR